MVVRPVPTEAGTELEVLCILDIYVPALEPKKYNEVNYD